jgi:hypothetical protein
VAVEMVLVVVLVLQLLEQQTLAVVEAEQTMALRVGPVALVLLLFLIPVLTNLQQQLELIHKLLLVVITFTHSLVLEPLPSKEQTWH